jgi:hypothetical protein
MLKKKPKKPKLPSLRHTTLIVDVERGFYYIAWCDPQDGEGARLGQDRGKPQVNLAKCLAQRGTPEETDAFAEYEYALVERGVAEYLTENKVAHKYSDGSCGFVFESLSVANGVRVFANALRKSAQQSWANETKPWPVWATLAQQAGWKPPKGWTP